MGQASCSPAVQVETVRARKALVLPGLTAAAGRGSGRPRWSQRSRRHNTGRSGSMAGAGGRGSRASTVWHSGQQRCQGSRRDRQGQQHQRVRKVQEAQEPTKRRAAQLSRSYRQQRRRRRLWECRWCRSAGAVLASNGAQADRAAPEWRRWHGGDAIPARTSGSARDPGGTGGAAGTGECPGEAAAGSGKAGPRPARVGPAVRAAPSAAGERHPTEGRLVIQGRQVVQVARVAPRVNGTRQLSQV